MGEYVKKILAVNPKLKKLAGILLILVGLTALVTPFTPGSWLFFLGVEFLRIRLLVWDKLKERFWKK